MEDRAVVHPGAERGAVFGVTVGGHTHWLAAPCAADARAWVAALSDAWERCVRDGGPRGLGLDGVGGSITLVASPSRGALGLGGGALESVAHVRTWRRGRKIHWGGVDFHSMSSSFERPYLYFPAPFTLSIHPLQRWVAACHRRVTAATRTQPGAALPPHHRARVSGLGRAGGVGRRQGPEAGSKARPTPGPTHPSRPTARYTVTVTTSSAAGDAGTDGTVSLELLATPPGRRAPAVALPAAPGDFGRGRAASFGLELPWAGPLAGAVLRLAERVPGEGAAWLPEKVQVVDERTGAHLH